MQSIPITEFKAHCLRLLEQVAATGEAIEVTKRGKPLVSVRSARQELPKRRLGVSVGKVKTMGDIVAPLDEPWDALAS